MLVNILLGSAIFSYAAWTIIRFYKKSKEGKCGGCSVKDSCQSSCNE